MPFPLPLSQSGAAAAAPDTPRVGLPGLRLCRGQVRPPGERRLGKGFALPLTPILVGGRLRPPPDTPLGWAYPVLDCAGVECGRRASAVRRVSGANLKVERLSFSSINRPEHRSSLKSWFGAETGEGLCPSPCPYPSQGGLRPPPTPPGVGLPGLGLCRGQVRLPGECSSESERSESKGRAFRLAE